jgi:hypothetical protein
MFKKGNNYPFSEIEDFCTASDLELIQYGEEVIGSHFLSIEGESTTYSFILVSATSKEYYYECIYSE